MNWVAEIALGVVVVILLAPLALGYALKRPSSPYQAHRRGTHALRRAFANRPRIERPDEAADAALGVFALVAVAAGIGIGILTRSGALGALVGVVVAFVAAALAFRRLNR